MRVKKQVEKSFRLLQLNEKLSRGGGLRKREIVDLFGIPEKTFHRDIDSLRQYRLENGDDIIYNRKENVYQLKSHTDQLTKQEIFAISKILIESRAFNRTEFEGIIEKLLRQCEVSEASQVKKLIGNQRLNYIELQHKKALTQELWELSDYISNKEVIRFDYQRQDGQIKSHQVKPVGIVFSEFYFYLLAYMVGKENKYPTIYRVDRISQIERTGKKFKLPYAERFSEAEFYQRIQFMYAGELKKVKFLYKGVLEALLDRLPTAKIEKETAEGYVITAEVFGNGIEMWLRSQGENVEMKGKE